jgi:O-antigen ligase
MAFILFFGAVVNAVGGEHIWSTFNRGQSARGIASMSGRTQVWQFVVQYCLDHPQGMGYIAGFRIRFQNYFTLGLQVEPSHIGVAHNTFIQVLADAGWLAFAIYIFMLIKVIVLGWRFAKKRWLAPLSLHSVPCHAIRCSLILLVFCLVYGMDGSDFVLPLRASFYMQNIIIGIILGASTEMLIASRVRHIYPTK